MKLLTVFSLTIIITTICLFTNNQVQVFSEKNNHILDYKEDYIQLGFPSKLDGTETVIPSERQFKILLDDANTILDDELFKNRMTGLHLLCEKKYYETCFVDHPSWEEFYNILDKELTNEVIFGDN